MRYLLLATTLLGSPALAAGVLPPPAVAGMSAGTFAAGNDARFTTLTAAAGNGITDDTAAFTAALAQPLAGVVTLQNKQYYLASSITIGQQVTLAGTGDPGGDVPNWNPSGTRPMLILGPGATINLAGTLTNAVVVRAGVNLNPQTAQTVIQNLASYGGTGVTMAGPGTLEHVVLLGHAQAIDTNNQANWRIRHVRGDNLAGLKINGMHDWSWFEDIEWMPMLSPGNGLGQFPTAAITGAAGSGAGLIRVTTGTAHGLATGNTAVIYNIGGLVAANGRWTVTVVDATHFDLQGSASAPSVTATATAGSATLQLTSIANLVPGQGVAGTGVPAGATITAVATPLNQVTLSAAVTASGSVTLAVTNPAYTSGGSVTLNTTSRPGPCLSVTSSESPMGTQYQCFGYDLGVSLGTGASWTTIYGLSLDDYGVPDPGKVGIAISGTALASKLHLGYVSSEWTPLQVNTTAGSGSEPHLIEGGSLYATAQASYGPPGLQFLSGAATLSADTCQAGQVYVAAAASVKFSGTNCAGAGWTAGSVLSNVTMDNSEFGDIGGATVRGPSITLAVPNGAGTAFAPAMQVQGNGTVLLGQGSTPPLQVASNGQVQVGEGNTLPFGPALHINTIAAFDADQGGQFELTNPSSGNPAPHKYVRVDAAGELQVLNSGYSAAMMTIDDAGNLSATSIKASGAGTFGGALKAVGHVAISGSAPVLAACGGTPALSATASDRHGTVTPGSGATGCVVTFNAAYATAPDCILTPWAAGTVPYVSAVGTASLTVGFAASGKFSYSCEQ